LKTNVAIAVLIVLGILGHVHAYRGRSPNAICGTDFPIFYAGARLLGTADLYSPAAVQRLQKQEIGCTSSVAAFIRLPYFAALVWPLTLLPLGLAFAVWRIALLAAEAGFVASFPRHWKWAVLACVWSFPLAWDFDNGQDVSFLLLAIAAGTVLAARRRSFAAGLCWSLCAAKFHLVVFLPLLLMARNRRAFSGLAAGGAVLLGISFAVGGWSWPGHYLAALLNHQIDPVPLELHNIRGLVQGSLAGEVVLGLTVVAAVWIVCLRAPFAIALSAVLAGGLLVSHHLTDSDWAMLLPVGLTLGVQAPARYIRIVAVLLITPLVTVLWGVPALMRLPDLALLGLVYALACESRKAARVETVENRILTSPSFGRIV
jgi:hypothetical protein